MTPPPSNEDRVERLSADLMTVRERLTRVEARLEALDEASEARHRELVAAVRTLGQRMEAVETRAWKLAMAMALAGIGGGAGGLQVVLSLLGG